MDGKLNLIKSRRKKKDTGEKVQTSNRASASMTILEMLARVLDSSAIGKDSHEHIPSAWSPNGHEEFNRPISSRPPRSLSQIYIKKCKQLMLHERDHKPI